MQSPPGLRLAHVSCSRELTESKGNKYNPLKKREYESERGSLRRHVADESLVVIADFWRIAIHRQKCGDFENMGSANVEAETHIGIDDIPKKTSDRGYLLNR